MELITPNVEIWHQEFTSNDILDGMWKHIARCTRVCYQSIPKNEKENDKEFVTRVLIRHSPGNSEANHLAMLEHGTVYLMVPMDTYTNSLDIEMRYIENPYSMAEYYNDVAYITTNYRVIVQNDWFDDLVYACKPTEYHKKRVTVSFTTNVGVSREFNRHRVNSIAEESTRYCNYSLDKFGKHITYVKPSWLFGSMPANTEQYEQLALDNIIKEYGTENEHNWEDIDYYLFSLMVSNYCYNNLILKGWTPQKAREVLPLATKTQLVHTAFVDDWKHFFALRADGVSGPPHPNAALLAKPLKEEFIKRKLI